MTNLYSFHIKKLLSQNFKLRPGACVLWCLVSDSQSNCEFWSWLFNLLYISQVTFIIPFTDGNLKISDWVLSALICMAQICFYAPNNSFFIRDSWSGERREALSCQGEDLSEENAHVIMEQFSTSFWLIQNIHYTLFFPYVPVALDNFLFVCVAWTSQVIHFVVISQWRFYFLPGFT